jgi:hypothetical protein
MEKPELRPAEKLALKMSMRMRRGEKTSDILREYIEQGIILGPEDGEGCKALVYLATFYAAHIII